MKHKEGYVLKVVSSDFIIVPIGQQVFKLNGLLTVNNTGAFLWSLLDSDQSIAQLAENLSIKYKLDLDRATTDTKLFIDEMSRIGLIDN